MSDDDQLLPLAVELMTASLGDAETFVTYSRERLDEALTSQDDAYDLIVRLAAFAGMAVRAWAEDTDRDPEDVLQLIALAAAQPDE